MKLDDLLWSAPHLRDRDRISYNINLAKAITNAAVDGSGLKLTTTLEHTTITSNERLSPDVRIWVYYAPATVEEPEGLHDRDEFTMPEQVLTLGFHFVVGTVSMIGPTYDDKWACPIQLNDVRGVVEALVVKFKSLNA